VLENDEFTHVCSRRCHAWSPIRICGSSPRENCGRKCDWWTEQKVGFRSSSRGYLYGHSNCKGWFNRAKGKRERLRSENIRHACRRCSKSRGESVNYRRG